MLRWRISAEGRNGAIAYDKYSVQHQILFSLMHGLYMEATDFWVCNNIMLTSKLVAKIGDLGVAKVVRAGSKETISKLQLTRAVPGTPDFMPPEVMEFKAIYGAPIDVFSFGGIVLYVFSEEWPTPSSQKMRDPVTKKLSALTEVERRQQYLDKMTGKAAGLIKIVQQCLDDDPDERPTIQEVSKKMESLIVSNYIIINFINYIKHSM